MKNIEKLREETRAPFWKALEEAVGGKLGKDICDAMRDLYTLYDDTMIDWFANLYDPKVGGYYYSNGARDNDTVTYQDVTYDLLPDAESTHQAMRFICGSGLSGKVGTPSVEVMPPKMKDQIFKFIKGLQDPCGFFYHPQWGKELTDKKLSRRARDLGWCTSILSEFGEKPTYDTPTGIKGDGLLADGTSVKIKKCSSGQAADNAPTTASVAIPDNMKDKESFLAYLGTLDVKHCSYPVGNTLTAQTGQLIYRDKVLASEGADYSLADIVIKWLNENQNPENGLWHDKANYYGVNGLMKISGVYGKIGVLLPNATAAAKSAIDAMSTDEIPDAATCVYNTWFAAERILRHIRTYGGEEGKKIEAELLKSLREKAPEAIRITKEKLAIFRKPDGGFSYCPTHSAARSQGMPVTHDGLAEGDINATIICSSDILVYIYASLGLSDYRVPIFCDADRERYFGIIKNKL